VVTVGIFLVNAYLEIVLPRSASFKAKILTKKPRRSESRWAASVIMAIEFDKKPPTTSAIMNITQSIETFKSLL